jgi:putative mRNA 3-end processing factor
MSKMLKFSDKGIFCPAGNFYIDPWRAVDKAIVTHAHSDHARGGSKYYLAHINSEPPLRARLGKDINLQTIEFGKEIDINGVKVSLHPAGHIIGSAQVRVEYKGEVWVVSGDYKTADDGLSGAFEPVKCNTFISESTFGLPVYNWKPQGEIFNKINKWWAQNKANGKQSVLIGYSLGKAQRILQHLDKSIGPIYAHTAVYNMQKAFVDFGLPIYDVQRWNPNATKEELKGAIIVAPSSATDTPWLRRFEPYSVGVCSGWMQIRGWQRRTNVDMGFPLSDHADWPGLISAIKGTGCEKVYITHGYQSVFSRYLNEIGIAADEVQTEYGGEEANEAESVNEKTVEEA